jgi:hypothetical protein
VIGGQDQAALSGAAEQVEVGAAEGPSSGRPIDVDAGFLTSAAAVEFAFAREATRRVFKSSESGPKSS